MTATCGIHIVARTLCPACVCSWLATGHRCPGCWQRGPVEPSQPFKVPSKTAAGPHRSTSASQMAPVVKNLPASAGDTRDSDSIPGSGRSPGGGQGDTLQYFCLENPMDRGAWWAVHEVAQTRTRLK